MLNDGAIEHAVCIQHARLQAFDRLFDVVVLAVSECNALRGDGGGDVSTGMTTHSICNKKQLVARVTRVLVRTSVLTDVAGCVANGFDGQGFYDLNSNVVVPILIVIPGLMVSGVVSFLPSR